MFATALAAVGAAQYSAVPLQPTTDGSRTPVLSSQGLGAGTNTQGGYTQANGLFRAALWTGTAGTYTDLHPSGYLNSTVQDVDNLSQVGYVGTTPTERHAALWYGSSSSLVDLHPSGYSWSQAWGVGGGNQVGFGQIGSNTHALLWSGSAGSMVDLHPAGYRNSFAYSTTASEQAGEAMLFTRPIAALWKGSAASMVSLHPAGYPGSGLYATDGTTQGGYVIFSGPIRYAAIWKGTAASMVNLHPAGLVNSMVWDVDGAYQAGYGRDASGRVHAILWNGTAASAIDLNQFLPSGYTDAYAFGVDANGRVTGHAKDASGRWTAFSWVRNYSFGEAEPANLDGGTFHETINIRFRLFDAAGAEVANEIITTQLEQLGTPDTVVPVAVYSNQGDTFTYNPSTGLYFFSLKVNGLASGPHRLTMTFGNGTSRVFTFNIR